MKRRAPRRPNPGREFRLNPTLASVSAIRVVLSPRRRGSRSLPHVFLDSRFRGNDSGCAVLHTGARMAILAGLRHGKAIPPSPRSMHPGYWIEELRGSRRVLSLRRASTVCSSFGFDFRRLGEWMEEFRNFEGAGKGEWDFRLCSGVLRC